MNRIVSAKYFLSGVVAAATMLPCPASAQQSAASDPQSADSGEILVTARKVTEKLSDVATAIVVLDRLTLSERGLTDVAALNSVVTNFSVQQTQQPGTVFVNIRGVTMQRFQEPSVAIVVDGVQLVSQYQIQQAFDDVEQIEVLRGPQGSLYGRNAIGGAINITTAQPTNDYHGKLEAGYAQGDSWTINGRLSGPIVDDSLLFVASAAYANSDGRIHNVFLDKTVDGEERVNLRGKLRFIPAANLSIDLTGSYENRDSGVAYFVSIPSNDVNDHSPQVQSGSEGRGKRVLKDLSAKISWEGPGFEVTSVSAYGHVRDDFYQDIDFGPQSRIDATQAVRVKSLSQELRIASVGKQAFRWLAGANYADIDQDITTLLYLSPCLGTPPCGTGPVDPATATILPFGINQNNNKTYGIFGQVDYDVAPSLTVTVGLRYDHDRRSQHSLTELTTQKKSFSALQPKLTISGHLSPDNLLFATVSRGFRSGAFNGTDYVTRLYDAETLWNYEVGGKFTAFDRRLRLAPGMFYMDYSNRQEYVLQPGTGAQTFFNIPRSRLWGVELDGSLRLAHGLDTTFGLGYINSKVKRTDATIAAAFGETFVGNRLPRVPSLSVNLGLRYSTDLSDSIKLVSRVDYSRWQGVHWSLGNRNDKQDGVDLLEAHVSLVYRDNLKFEIYSKNLLNTKYFGETNMPGFGAIGVNPGAFPAQPRQIGGKVALTF